MNLMKSLDEYEELLAPARQRFAVKSWHTSDTVEFRRPLLQRSR